MTDDVFGIVGTVQGGSFRVEEAIAEGGVHVGPARTFWIAGPLAIVGLVLLISRLLAQED